MKHHEKYAEHIEVKHGRDHESTLHSEVTYIDTDTKRIIISKMPNMTVLGGRLDIQEQLFGMNPNPNQHILLSRPDILGVPHSLDVFATNRSLERRTRWFMIGTGAENPSVPFQIYKPRNYETKLYNHVPFRCVPIGAPLTSEEAAPYRLKKIINIGGSQYIAYYAKVFSVDALELTFNENIYTPVVEDTIPVVNGDVTHRLSGGKVLCCTRFTLTVDRTEFKEWYRYTHNNNLDGARLSELGLIMGLDAANNGQTFEIAGPELVAKLTHSPVPMDDEGSSRIVEYRIYT